MYTSTRYVGWIEKWEMGRWSQGGKRGREPGERESGELGESVRWC